MKNGGWEVWDSAIAPYKIIFDTSSYNNNFWANISDDGKINLSIKRAEEQSAAAPARSPRAPRRPESERPRENAAPRMGEVAPRSENQEFEDKLKKFMQESDSRIADNRLYADRPRRGRKH